MRTNTITAVLAATALSALVPAAASAQPTDDVVVSDTEDDDGFPWGLLGLFGLAGLLGLKRRDHVDVDNRRR